MSIFIILRLVQCTRFALYVLWNKWSTVMVKLVNSYFAFIFRVNSERQFQLQLAILLTSAIIKVLLIPKDVNMF